MINDAYINISHDRFQRLKAYDESHFAGWLKDEYDYRKRITERFINQPDVSYINRIKQYVGLISPTVALEGTPLTLESFRNVAADFYLPFHDDDDDDTEHLVQIAANKGDLPAILFNFRKLLEYRTVSFTNEHIARLQMLDREHTSNIARLLETTVKSIDTIKLKIDEDLGIIRGNNEKELAKIITSAKDQITKIVSDATSAVFSAEPIKYWEEKKSQHAQKVSAYGKRIKYTAGIFLALLIALICLVYIDSVAIDFYGHKFTLPSRNFSFALLILFATSAIWLVRIMVKIMMTNVALEIEALERLTMIKTYIAMNSAQPEKSVEAETLFFSTLFRPSPNNLTDDTASPEFLKIIEAITQKKP